MERKVKHYSTWKNSVVSLQSNFIIIILIIVIIIVIHLLKVDQTRHLQFVNKNSIVL